MMMMISPCRLLLTLLLGSLLRYEPVQCKQYMRCELTRELLFKYKFSKSFISSWICMIEHESLLNTNKVTTKPNGSRSFGLFQINSKDYCRIDRPGGHCQKKCSDFTDENISDDVECAQMIFHLDGFKHWQGWNSFCHNRNLPNLSVACNFNSLSAYRKARAIQET